MKSAFVSFFVFFCFTPVFGQNILEDSHNLSIGGATVALRNIHSIWSNQAGLAFVDQTSASGFVQQLYGLADLRTVGIGIAHPTSSGTFGLVLNYLGTDQFQEQKAGIAYSRKLMDRFSIGAQFFAQNTRIDEYGNTAVFSFEFGLLAELLPDLYLGVHTQNPVRVSVLEDEDLPIIYSLGIAYILSKKAFINLELEKDIEYPVRFKAGISYHIIEQLALRTGVATQPANLYLGIGYLLNQQLSIDLAMAQHPQLGISPSLGINYQLNK